LRPYIGRCGYLSRLIREDYPFTDHKVPLVAFAHEPFDARSACIAIVGPDRTSVETLGSYRELGAPIISCGSNDHLEWWSQGSTAPVLKKQIPLSSLEAFFREHRNVFAPEAIYRAKTRGRLDRQYQLEFVDVGLMPLVEEEIGRKLAQLVERVLLQLRHDLGWSQPSIEEGRLLIRYTFWLLAGKILHDKQVPGFQNIDLFDAEETFARVQAHYGARSLNHQRRRRSFGGALAAAAQIAAGFASLNHVTTEALAEVYESSLITNETRRYLGIHSTPPWLVDYMLWRLEPWIRELPLGQRTILEPGCGHGAFLVAGLRFLRELLPKTCDSQQRRRYLRRHLIGIEFDEFAIELARLSLTLADIPNPNGWKLISGNMFADGVLDRRIREATILLANPPFEDFTTSERSKLRPQTINKASEMLVRSLPTLRRGGVFGVIVPASFLESKNAAQVRSLLINGCELQEVSILPDKVFRFSDMECAILLGRKVGEQKPPKGNVRFRWVREQQIEDFRRSYSAADERLLPQQLLAQTPHYSLFAPQLEEIWEFLKDNPRLEDVTQIGEGLSFKGEDSLLPGVITYSQQPFPGAVKGFVRLGRDLQLHGRPAEMYLNISAEAVRVPRSGAQVRIPQVLMNHVRVSRGPWRIKAFIDFAGHACTNNFNTVRQRIGRFSLEFTWAILNSPIANAYVYTHTWRRHNLPGRVGQIPIPKGLESFLDISTVVALVRDYHQLLQELEASPSAINEQAFVEAKRLLLKIDAEILKLYSLPVRLERKLLDLFFGYQREGVPFTFTEYYPLDYRPWFSLHEYFSKKYQSATVGELLKQWEESVPQAVHDALAKAVEEFEG